MSKIQHKDLPDQYLHEPKGASTAVEGTVYVSSGDGSGSFSKLPVSSLDFTGAIIPEIAITTIPTPVVENGAGLLQTADGVMADVAYVTQVPVTTIDQINKNLKELYTIYVKDVQIHAAVKADVEALATKLNSVISALQTIGFFANE